jgi:ParB-like chromosome segregation protein Spo0J
MKIEQLPTADLIPYARNTRTHSPEQVAQIAGSIREFGFTNPVLIDADNGIIAGHGRVMAAQKLGLAKVPCIRLAHLTETQKRAYIIADNKLALNAGWDEEMLGLELADLREADFDFDVLGFDNFAIEQFLNPPERNDEAPESSGGEIDVDGMQMECACPKCGFEFDPKKP